tara:strand:- start:8314 stop:10104 length:1791 start_codon:yes stop_codon:yes gene_type:complete
MKYFKYFLKIFKNNKLIFISSNILSIFSAIFGGLTIGLIVPLLDPSNDNLFGDSGLDFLASYFNFINNYEGVDRIRVVCLIILVVGSLEFLTTVFTSYLSSILQLKVLKTTQEMLIEKIDNLEIIDFYKFEQGRIFSLITNDSRMLSRMVSRILNSIKDLWLLAIFLFVLFLVSPIMTFSAFFLLGIISILINSKLGNVLKKRNFEFANKTQKINGELYETLSAFKYLKASGNDSLQFQRINKLFQNWRDAEWNILKISILPQPVFTLLNTYSITLLLFIGTILFPSDRNDWLSLMIPFLFLIFKLMPTISNLNNSRIKLRSVRPYFERIDNFLANNNFSSVNFGASKIESIESIQLKNLNFNFSNNNLFSLQDINLEFHLNQLTAIVGPSGGGKTTLVDIILGLYSDYDGSLLINGSELKEFDIKNYRNHIAYVDQQNFLFNRTIKENIIMFNSDIGDDFVVKAAKKAGAHDFIISLPNGYETLLGESGISLSGGQKQRIGLSRAFLSTASFIILDESTSNLDYKTEKEVMNKIKLLNKDKGVIIIAHRLSSIYDANNIVYIDNGKIIESGTHSDLILKKGKYFEQLSSSNVTDD